MNNVADHQILIIDNIGMLSSLYGYGFAAYIGGGFGVSIHNTLEAAVYGIPVIFGPKYHKFQEAIDMIKNGAAFVVTNPSDYFRTLQTFFQQPETLQKAGEMAAAYINSQAGATEKVMDYIHEYVF